jgi:hypothetical protein
MRSAISSRGIRGGSVVKQHSPYGRERSPLEPSHPLALLQLAHEAKHLEIQPYYV